MKPTSEIFRAYSKDMSNTCGEPDTPRGVSPVRREGTGNLFARAQAPDPLLYGGLITAYIRSIYG